MTRMKMTAVLLGAFSILGLGMGGTAPGGQQKSKSSKAHPDSALAKLAAAMKPGTFALLNQEGDSSGYGWNLVSGTLKVPSGVGSILGYAQKAAYDPVTDTVYFCGQAHAGDQTLIQYSIAANKWTGEVIPNEFWAGHSHDSCTINPTAREFYYNGHVTFNLKKYNLETRQWSKISGLAHSGGEPSVEYFPERDELLYLGGSMLAALKHGSDTWRTVDTSLALGRRGPVAKYNPVHKCVLLMGGIGGAGGEGFVHSVYKYDRDGKITRLKDNPETIMFLTSDAVASADPVTGDFVVIQAVVHKDYLGARRSDPFTGEIEFWKYDIVKDVWAKMDPNVIPKPAEWWPIPTYPFAVVATPIPTYGVILYMSAAMGRSRVYLYKHAAGKQK